MIAKIFNFPLPFVFVPNQFELHQESSNVSRNILIEKSKKMTRYEFAVWFEIGECLKWNSNFITAATFQLQKAFVSIETAVMY